MCHIAYSFSVLWHIFQAKLLCLIFTLYIYAQNAGFELFDYV